MGRLILASASPRRQELLREAGYEFLSYPADVDEAAIARQRPNLSPEDLAAHLAGVKARMLADRFPDDVVLAADTVVAKEAEILGKPLDANDARRILTLLSGTTHRVITGVAVVSRRNALMVSESVASTVEMRPLSSPEIETYIATNQWHGKAGAYGIQDPDPFVTRVAGCATNIVGLPMTTTARLLRAARIVPGEIRNSKFE
ncbi:MAG: Maf family protein [Tepidisphaeraceae bacterium]|jgi:nucleoside triphosphate pyrophosphatase